MKRKSSKYLEFYKECMKTKVLPYRGLCSCAIHNWIDMDLLMLFSPTGDVDSDSWYWGIDGLLTWERDEFEFSAFTPLRQTIVLFMHEMTVNPIEE